MVGGARTRRNRPAKEAAERGSGAEEREGGAREQKRGREGGSELGISPPTSQLGDPSPGERPRKGPVFLPSRSAKWPRRAPRAKFAQGLFARGKGRDPGLFPCYQMSPK